MDSRKREYEKRVNRVIDYINSNLDQNLSLNVLAQVALFSSFHFHRIFKAFTGEPLNDYIRRLRLEKGANMLIVHPYKAITDIALDCGFSSSAAWSRAFKEYFGVSPSGWRKSKNSKTNSNFMTNRVMSCTTGIRMSIPRKSLSLISVFRLNPFKRNYLESQYFKREAI